MTTILRKSGIPEVGDVPWGTHLCLLYETRGDLVGALVPYFRSGLENNEFCLWVLPEQLNESAAREALLREVPTMKTYLERGQMEFMQCSDWYLPGGAFDPLRFSQMTMRTLDRVCACGFDGMRLAGSNAAWVRAGEWKAFAAYEKAMNNALAACDMLVISSYPSDRCGPDEMVDIMSSHHGVITRCCGRQSYLENAAHKRADEALRVSENYYRSIFEHTGAATAIVEEDGTISLANSKFEQLSGRRREEIEGRLSGLYFLHPDDRDRIAGYHRHRRTDPGTAPRRYECRVMDRSGAVKDVSVTIEMIPGTQKSVVSLIDITDFKTAELKLRESWEKYRDLVENMNEILYSLDLQGRVTYISPVVERVTAHTVGEITGRSFEDFIHADDLPPVREALARILSGSVESFEFRVMNKNDIINIRSSSRPLRHNGAVTGISGLLSDVTKQKSAEAAFRRADAELRQVLSSISDYVWSADVGPSGTLSLRYFSPVIEKISGYPPEIVMEDPDGWLRIIHADDRPRFTKSVDCVLSGESTREEMEYRIIRRDGTTGWVRDSIVVRELGNGRICLDGVMSDITARKGMDDALLESEVRYRSLFEDSPISLWEEDFSEVKKLLDGLRESGVRDFRAYLEANHAVVEECQRLVKLVDVNKATVSLYHANDKKELLQGLDRIFTDRTSKDFQKALILITEGGTRLEAETVHRTLTGESMFVSLWWLVAPGHEETYGKVFVSIVDITKRKKAEDQLLTYHRQLRSLSAELSMTEERERRRIATDLHDHIGQTLAMAKIKLGILRQEVSAGPANSIDEVRGLVDESIQYARSLTFELSMPILYELGLESALEWLAEHVQTKYGLPVSISVEGPPASLGDEPRTLLFKTVRELLMNVIKHARAKGAEVRVCNSSEEVRISVEDDGRGFAVSPGGAFPGKTGGFGLFSVRERLKHWGGSMNIESAPGRGTRATIRIYIRSKGSGYPSAREV